LAVTLGTATGGAFPELVQLEWRAPLECPQQVDVEDGVRRLVGDAELFDAAGSTAPGGSTNFSATMTEVQRGAWNLVLRVTSSAGTRTRELTGDSCHELTEAGIAVIALALSESTSKPGASDAPESVPTSSAKTSSPPPPPAVRDEPASSGVQHPEKPEGSSWGALAALVVDLNVLPTPAVGAALGASYGVGSFWLSAQGIYLPPQQAALTNERGADISLLAASLSGCYWALGGRLAAGPCMKLEAGVLPAQGVSDHATSGNGRWAAVVPGIAAQWWLSGSWGLLLGAELVLPLVRDEFMLGTEQVYRIPPLSGRIVLGPEVRFQ
jgi:hypothetical protein